MFDYPQIYEGTEPYIFISYAHKNTDVVLPIISGLQDRGFRVWYDAGIETGTEWPEFIADRLAGCGCAIIMVTEAALESHNCRREIHYAISQKVPMLVVYLEDAKLSRGMEMQLGVLQALFRSRHTGFDSFMDKLSGAALLQNCKAAADVKQPAAKVTPVVSERPSVAVSDLRNRMPRKHSWIALGTICAAIVIFSLAGLYVAPGFHHCTFLLVILGAVLLGPGAGVAFGAVYGIMQLLGSVPLVFPYDVIEDVPRFLVLEFLLIAVGCPLLLGLTTGWMWELARKVNVHELLALLFVSFLNAMARQLVANYAVDELLPWWNADWIAVKEHPIRQMILGGAFISGLRRGITTAIVVTVLYKVLTVLNRRLMKLRIKDLAGQPGNT